MVQPRKLTANFVETEVDGEVLIVDLDGGELFSLSGTARDIWRLIDGRRSAEAIAEALQQEFTAPAGAVEHDVRALLDKLQDATLVALA